MIRLQFCLMALLGLLIYSCEQPADLDLGGDVARLVVVSNFSDLDTLEVVVSKSNSVLENGPAEYVGNAVVEIYDGDKNLDVLEYVPTNNLVFPGYYRSNFVVPQPGVEYRIEVSAPGFEPVSARNAIPVSEARIDTTAIAFNLEIEEVDLFFNLASFTVTVKIVDEPLADNYFHLNFYQEAFNYRIDTLGDTLSQQFFSLPLTLDAADDNQPFVPYLDDRGVLILDDSFDGQTGTFEFSGSYLYNRNDQFLGSFVIELRSTTEEYYLYHTTLARQFQASADPLSNPVILFSNIENGYGIFAGFDSRFYLVDLSQ